MTHAERARQLRPFVVKASESLSDSDALDAIELYDFWEPDTEYKQDKRLRHPKIDSKLWKVKQTHTSQAQYPPSIDTAALYEEVHKPGQGDTPDNPIPYNNNMALIMDKYYSQHSIVYRCFRDTINPVYADLSALVGIYVEVWEPNSQA